MRMKPLLAAAFSLIASAHVLAHHGGAESTIYKGSTPIELTGTIVNVEWFNPHSFLLIDVTDAAGKATRWRLEFAPPRVLTRQGWTRQSMKQGDQVSVTAMPARDGSATAYVRAGTLANGKKMVDTSLFLRDGTAIKFGAPTK